MATGAAGDGLIRSVFEGCTLGSDAGIQRRPYHRNCGCALHKWRGHCSHATWCTSLSYPIRRTWSEGCLTLMASTSPGPASPGSSPAKVATDVARTTTTTVEFALSNEE